MKRSADAKVVLAVVMEQRLSTKDNDRKLSTSHTNQLPPCVHYSGARWRFQQPGLPMAMSTLPPSSCSRRLSTLPSGTLPAPDADSSSLLNSATKLSRGEAITSEISSTLSHCPSDHYVLISQPGVTASDYASRKATPALAQRLSSKDQHNIRSSVSVPEVKGEVDVARWEQTLKKECGAEVLHVDASSGSIPSYKSMPKVVSISFPSPTSGNRLHDLSVNDAFLASILDMLPSSNYTVLYTTSTHGSSEPSADYLMDSEVQDPLHMEMKRDLGSGLRRRASNQTIIDGPLFDKYQFFTPGEYCDGFVGDKRANEFRYLHGLPGRLHSLDDPVRWNLRFG